MNLRKKKILAAKTLGVGKNRIIFMNNALNEIKEAITKQDIKSLHTEGAILIRPVKGRRRKERIHRKIGHGKMHMNVRTRKRDYIILTRKLRSIVAFTKNSGALSKEMYYEIRKKIKNRYFKSSAHLKDYIKNMTTTASKTKEKVSQKKKTTRNKKQ